MYRVCRLPPPLSVTRPPPSSTTWWLVFLTLAVAVMVMVTGAAPQLKVMMPPCATALITAAEVQPAGVPVPMTWSGWPVLTAAPACGTLTCPAGLPKSGRRCAAGLAAFAAPGAPRPAGAVVLAEAVAAKSPLTASAPAAGMTARSPP